MGSKTLKEKNKMEIPETELEVNPKPAEPEPGYKTNILGERLYL